LDLVEELQIRASGINATLGAIYRPLDIVQVGLSYTTPTLLSVTDVYRAELTAEWNNFDYYDDDQTILNTENEYTDEIISEYSLRTPGKLSAGATVFLGKSGFISADVDLINYSGARYSSGLSGISFDSDNENIKDLYQATTNVRLGGEFRLDKL
ncbi:MAG TPA: long-chain fatty acid transporter, partial [Cyclobacteriaceae bacterium]|nr:long-chain fatty acid transporter [Cyclobacteriaceae bacterium]